jgi:hypothetical protein
MTTAKSTSVLEFTAEYNNGRFYRFDVPWYVMEKGEYMVRPYAEELQECGMLPKGRIHEIRRRSQS